MHWDFTVNLSNIITWAMLLVGIIIGYRDLHWRVKNLEHWRLEQVQYQQARAENEDKFETAVSDFKVAIATLNAKLAALDREEERRIFFGRKEGK